MELSYSLIGLSGVAKSGKDTLCEFLIKEFKNQGIEAKRYSIADIIRDNLKDVLVRDLGIDPYNCSPSDKELIRPLMVEYGLAIREKTNGLGFTQKVLEKIKSDGNILPIVTDIRYDEFEEDEVQWVKSNGGKLVHVSKLYSDSTKAQPANELEERNDPKIYLKSDFKMVWWDSESFNGNLPVIRGDEVISCSQDEYFQSKAKYVISGLNMTI